MRIIKNPSVEEVSKLIENRKSDVAGTEELVKSIVENIRKNGDSALIEYVNKYEKCKLTIDDLKVSQEQINQAQVSEEFERLVDEFISRLESYHRLQLEADKWMLTDNGSLLGYMSVPLESVGIYVPSGKGVYFSTLLMCAVPAKIAGVKRIVIATPPNEYGSVSEMILYIAKRLGISEIYKMGGAHAVASLAYGTQTIKRVDKIVGPGNKYVALAKKLIIEDCGIDSIAGPSEVLIIADESANPRFLAWDLLSQAEHDEDAMSVLITTSEQIALAVQENIGRYLQKLAEPNRTRAKTSLEKNGYVLLVDDLSKAAKFSNLIAPEHLEIVTQEPYVLLKQIKNAGSVFLGNFSSEPIGDYGIGPNHVLPTFSTARFSSGLSVSDFVKKVFVTQVTSQELMRSGEQYVKLARLEGFEAHAMAVQIRLEELGVWKGK
ncbi:histidinol dehydrogenase [Fervidobacterium thailandense]|uniref:Histidinol dehydrogenase n=1 Tax=Fervidobacterium thailandense TaxID=1008305 RepID=A0A1E3G199_9BACT|nr:histidinol dehydrogenase [Fervidobacterium thailandense]ODN30005.1 histidinol dehydrogenase [Fervidobacterium thailandense]